ncbi:MAG: hypothetical protein Tsb0021_06440 [Chlamydiales bacterium]
MTLALQHGESHFKSEQQALQRFEERFYNQELPDAHLEHKISLIFTQIALLTSRINQETKKTSKDLQEQIKKANDALVKAYKEILPLLSKLIVAGSPAAQPLASTGLGNGTVLGTVLEKFKDLNPKQQKMLQGSLEQLNQIFGIPQQQRFAAFQSLEKQLSDKKQEMNQDGARAESPEQILQKAKEVLAQLNQLVNQLFR